MSDEFIVYLITNTLNDKKYVGITSKSLSQRWDQHIRTSTWKQHYCLHRAIKKYGAESFLAEELAVVHTWKDACQLEQILILFFDSYCKNHGYNMTFGGDGVRMEHSEETKEKLRLAANRQFADPAVRERARQTTIQQYIENPHLREQHRQRVLGNKWRANADDVTRFDFQGERLTALEWSKRTGIKPNTILMRVNKYNWPVEKALTTPAPDGVFLMEFNGECLSAGQWSKRTGIKTTTLLNRVKKHNWPVDKALTTPTQRRT